MKIVFLLSSHFVLGQDTVNQFEYKFIMYEKKLDSLIEMSQELNIEMTLLIGEKSEILNLSADDIDIYFVNKKTSDSIYSYFNVRELRSKTIMSKSSVKMDSIINEFDGINITECASSVNSRVLYWVLLSQNVLKCPPKRIEYLIEDYVLRIDLIKYKANTQCEKADLSCYNENKNDFIDYTDRYSLGDGIFDNFDWYEFVKMGLLNMK